MMRLIPFFCVSLFCFSLNGIDVPFLQDHNLIFEAVQTDEGKWECGRTEHPFIISATENLKGILNFEAQSFDFTLQDLGFALREGGKKTESTLENPGQMLELMELVALKGKSIPFSLNGQHLQFAPEFLRQYGDLKSFKSSFFEGIIGAELQTLFEIAALPLKQGEPYEIDIPKTDLVPYLKKKSLLLKEITPSFYVVEVTHLIDRQRVALGDENYAVVYGHSVTTFKIDRQNGLLFESEELGTLSLAIKSEEVEAIETHATTRKVWTKETLCQ